MKLKVKEIALFSILGTILFVSKIVMEALPNVHLLGTLIVAFTVVFRAKALIPVYVYVFLCGLYAGFAPWWVPYIYIWAVLVLLTLLIPKKIPPKFRWLIYLIVSGLHGFLFGTLYAPAQSLMFGLNFEATIAWIIAGLPFDLMHGVSNLVCGVLIMPIVKALNHVKRMYLN